MTYHNEVLVLNTLHILSIIYLCPGPQAKSPNDFALSAETLILKAVDIPETVPHSVLKDGFQ